MARLIACRPERGKTATAPATGTGTWGSRRYGFSRPTMTMRLHSTSTTRRRPCVGIGSCPKPKPSARRAIRTEPSGEPQSTPSTRVWSAPKERLSTVVPNRAFSGLCLEGRIRSLARNRPHHCQRNHHERSRRNGRHRRPSRARKHRPLRTWRTSPGDESKAEPGLHATLWRQSGCDEAIKPNHRSTGHAH